MRSISRWRRGSGWGGSTYKGDAIYLHILRWPAETVALPAIPRRIVRHSLLTGGSAEVKQSGTGIEVRVPAAHRHAVDTIVKLQLDGPAAGISAIQPG
jgi:alpha-L-fucosidase